MPLELLLAQAKDVQRLDVQRADQGALADDGLAVADGDHDRLGVFASLLPGLLGAGRVVEGVGRHQAAGDGFDGGSLLLRHPGTDKGGQAAADLGHLGLLDLALHGPDQDPHRLVPDRLPLLLVQGQDHVDDFGCQRQVGDLGQPACFFLRRGIGILADRDCGHIVQDLARLDLLLPGDRRIRGIKDVQDGGSLGVPGLLGLDLAFVGQVARRQPGDRADVADVEGDLVGGKDQVDEQHAADKGRQQHAQD